MEAITGPDEVTSFFLLHPLTITQENVVTALK
jgi:hypothetical protein